MNLALILVVIVAMIASISCFNPLGILNTCVTDSQCKKHDEFCDHTGLNPIGECKMGYSNGVKCHFDRHCRSKNCYSRKCVPRKPEKDGPCSKDQHDECIESQYCSHKENIYKCRDRSYSGACTKSQHCLSNKCLFFKCRRPKNMANLANADGGDANNDKNYYATNDNEEN